MNESPATVSAFLTQGGVLQLDDLALMLSLFDDPDRLGLLASLRRDSGAGTIEELSSYIAAAALTRADKRALSADIKARTATVDADILRVFLPRFLIETGAGADLGFSDAEVRDLLD